MVDGSFNAKLLPKVAKKKTFIALDLFVVLCNNRGSGSEIANNGPMMKDFEELC